ncbi:hypothetical protein FEM48_Zijuj10G0109500 [Ziziphus jujuba var. spinosa]|uniref:NADP-dependent oxidoreductase domain-containing protein n=1 Tax=Ziziphus jujuba var. spinosa TaxID=714518 RepID=A0A978UMZ2_ZIZJJ|nr:hypothetical protein FEM48_Zijuj10G0109500 [Ziziphus jujuba var. spinosa]
MLKSNATQLEVAGIPTATLGLTGKTIPILGFGTAEYPFGPLGEAIAQALKLGLVQSREQLFITSKLFPIDAHHDLVLPAIRKTLMYILTLEILKNLGLEYLDLYLIHFPASLKRGANGVTFSKEDIMAMDMESVWKAMEECQKLGLTKSIGVSNFTCKKLEELLATASIPPAANQRKLREYCAEKGIHITAYSPLGGRGTPWGSNRVLECKTLQEIAEAKGKTVAQQGVSLVVKSFREERIAENLDILDWKLTEEELQKISQIPQKRGSLAENFIYDNGPYKSVMEIWDGDV